MFLSQASDTLRSSQQTSELSKLLATCFVECFTAKWLKKGGFCLVIRHPKKTGFKKRKFLWIFYWSGQMNPSHAGIHSLAAERWKAVCLLTRRLTKSTSPCTFPSLIHDPVLKKNFCKNKKNSRFKIKRSRAKAAVFQWASRGAPLVGPSCCKFTAYIFPVKCSCDGCFMNVRKKRLNEALLYVFCWSLYKNL